MIFKITICCVILRTPKIFCEVELQMICKLLSRGTSLVVKQEGETVILIIFHLTSVFNAFMS